jgi:hypothetical protein
MGRQLESSHRGHTTQWTGYAELHTVRVSLWALSLCWDLSEPVKECPLVEKGKAQQSARAGTGSWAFDLTSKSDLVWADRRDLLRVPEQ